METADKVAGLDQGADAYLVDPIEPDEMLSTVRALLRLVRGAQTCRGAGHPGQQAEPGRRSSQPRLTAARLSEATARAAAEVLDPGRRRDAG